MMRVSLKMAILSAALVAVAPVVFAPAVAEGPRDRSASLVSLSEIFGELHHIRRTCEPRREGDIWRNRMKRLIDLEAPDSGLRERMVVAFNKGYQNAQRRFSRCDRDAENYAASRAASGETIVAELTAPLQVERGPDDPDVTVYRGAETN
ncbi:MAG: TIGR02301 family protein [Parvularculaceae bacterium]